ncbi:MAG: sialidase family protein, partial [Phycisphaeraceae bacterium]|nr:sialidase family protein [Phycisphaeraceae bacterium]
TGVMGGVAGPTAAQLAVMHKGDYVYHARDGQLSNVTAQKVALPRDPVGQCQGMALTKSDDGVLWADTGDLLHKSVDDGRTWATRSANHVDKWAFWIAGRGGALLSFTCESDEGALGPVTIWRSDDEGESFEKLSEIPMDFNGTPHAGHTGGGAEFGFHRLPDGMLLLGMVPRTMKCGFFDAGPGESMGLYIWRSDDGGRTWQAPGGPPALWACEGAATKLPSGRLLATVRYQRPTMPDDPPNMMEIARSTQTFPWKHIFLLESDDHGATWGNFRRLTMHHGQCWGFPIALADGTVLVVHDTRYGPGEPSGRAMVSHDQAATWSNEAYYLYYGSAVSGYSRSVVLGDGTIVTLCGTCEHPPAANTWDEMVGNSDHTIIRWRAAQ